MMISRALALVATFTFSVTAAARVATGSRGRHFQAQMFDNQKVQKKADARWTLTDWLSQKNKMRLADQWLAMNSGAVRYELNLSGAHSKYKIVNTDALGVKTETTSDAAVYKLDIWISIFNMYGEYEKTSNHQEQWGGAAGLRLFGTSSQTTSILGRYGWRKLTHLDTQEVWENLWVEGELQLYIFKFFGLSGRYRRIFPAKSNLENTLEGTRSTGGAFIEFDEFRLYGDVYTEPLDLKDSSGVKTKEERSGYEAGIKFHF